MPRSVGWFGIACGIAASLSISSSLADGHAAATPSDECAVIQTAFTSMVHSPVDTYPKAVRPSHRRIGLSSWTKDASREVGLSSGEYADLAWVESSIGRQPYVPNCRWKGTPAKVNTDDGNPMVVEITRPIFSSGRRLAVVEISLMLTQGVFGSGQDCIVRKNGEWSAVCTPSWIR
jgi:hypothetical protein